MLHVSTPLQQRASVSEPVLSRFGQLLPIGFRATRGLALCILTYANLGVLSKLSVYFTGTGLAVFCKRGIRRQRNQRELRGL